MNFIEWLIFNLYNVDIEIDKLEVVKIFQTASLHRNDEQTILKVGGGRNGKRR